jgi:ceramide glucosyltransferase
MPFDVAQVLAGLTLFSCVVYISFSLLFAIGTRRIVRVGAAPSAANNAGDLPGVSILKPCAGDDDDLESCLRSFCALRYPSFEILCGVRDDGDPALDVLERIRIAHPEVQFRVIRTNQGRCVNPKVAQLDVLERAARFDTLWISDSNTLVHPDTLTSMVRELSAPGVGLVVSPVVGTSERTLGAALDNLHLSAFVTSGSFAILAITGRFMAPGKSALVRRRSLEAIGGFTDLGRYCAEDFLMAERLRSRGEAVVYGSHVVANVNTASDVSKFCRRHFRWLQLNWLLVGATVLEPFIFPMLFASLWLAIAPSWHAFEAMLTMTLLQSVGDLWAMARLRGGTLRARHLAAVLMRPYLFAALWAASPFVRKIVWRGNVRWLTEQTRLLEERPSGFAWMPRTR